MREDIGKRRAQGSEEGHIRKVPGCRNEEVLCTRQQKVGAEFMVWWKKSGGSVTELLTTGICVIAMSIIVMSFLNNVQLVHKRAEVSQLARKYILRMETLGFLRDEDKEGLVRELDLIGIKDISLSGTTLHQVDYGNTITLSIQGTIQGKAAAAGSGLFSMSFQNRDFSFRENRMTTAKN